MSVRPRRRARSARTPRRSRARRRRASATGGGSSTPATRRRRSTSASSRAVHAHVSRLVSSSDSAAARSNFGRLAFSTAGRRLADAPAALGEVVDDGDGPGPQVGVGTGHERGRLPGHEGGEAHDGVVLAPRGVEDAYGLLGEVEHPAEVARLPEHVDGGHGRQHDAEAVDGPPLPQGVEEVWVDGVATTGAHEQGGTGEDRAAGLRGRSTPEVEAASRAVPVAEPRRR